MEPRAEENRHRDMATERHLESAAEVHHPEIGEHHPEMGEERLEIRAGIETQELLEPGLSECSVVDHINRQRGYGGPVTEAPEAFRF